MQRATDALTLFRTAVLVNNYSSYGVEYSAPAGETRCSFIATFGAPGDPTPGGRRRHHTRDCAGHPGCWQCRHWSEAVAQPITFFSRSAAISLSLNPASPPST